MHNLNLLKRKLLKTDDPDFLQVLNTQLKDARFVVLPLPYEATTSYGKGTASGPAAIIDALSHVELYDDELRAWTYRKGGIHIIFDPELDFKQKPDKFMPSLMNYTQNLLTKLSPHQVLVGLGGEHSVSYPLIKACQARYPKLSVLHLDAHSDLRQTYEGSIYNHACVMRRVIDLKVPSIVQVGIRSMTEECYRLMKKRPLKTFLAHESQDMPGLPRQVLKNLISKDVFVTIDLDVFDPSIMPGVGTPEPGGLGWYPMLDILRTVFRHKNVVGFDIVELMPLAGSTISEFTAAKLMYRLMGYPSAVRL